MSPLTDRSQAKEGGWQQVREALTKFEGDVASAEFDRWGGKLVDDDGKPVPPKEFMEIKCMRVHVLETTEPLSMEIEGGEYSFRVNCSDFKGSFWVDKFLESSDRNKIQIPDGLIGKRVRWEKATQEAKDPKFNSTNYVIGAIIGDAGQASEQTEAPAPQPVKEEDLVNLALGLAVGKTEQQFRTAASVHPQLVGTPLLGLIKAGGLTQNFVGQGKLRLVDEDGKQVYREPEVPL